mmetsp:Transcript_21428/g.27710  ORF Transcript_21428/g.27710 Transcript_21428/m.27710 type:complete len:401 (+) Transcript_21428:144-1346(+)|eukprot:CAMPEP_0198151150 /NCGR_PEP_ID=MMETSP1443-20131203/54444_1 /TAXON_ID=186043 /ORGANISM="Entomoneis sp., Strain CCMP2396" /LENGTH=400 /DNA_ID=CAMNT_0043816727 /DNA_START=91 /DNA_END=1293 /DNA_ORIENTATION=-
MDSITQAIDAAVPAKNYTSLCRVFSDYAMPGSVSWQSVGQGEQRSIAAYFIQKATSTPGFLPAAFSHEEMMQVMTKALGHLPITVEKAADNTLRQQMFEYLINSDDADYAGAARILSGMRMEEDAGSVYYMTAAARTDVYVRIAECFLSEDEIAESDAAVQKAGGIVESIPDKENHTSLILRYKSTYARVLDSNRKFLQAAQRYHELSQSATDLIDADDLLQMLGRGATCAILAPSGPQRGRVLGHICKDERLSQLDRIPSFATHSKIILKMHSHQILRPNELKQFESSLAEHQKALMGDGLTIMERGVVEHNMIAVGNLYSTIYLKELALILGVTEKRAESIAANMIMDGSLHGIIDQVDGLLVFEQDESPDEGWDRSITSFCLELNRTNEAIKATSSS